MLYGVLHKRTGQIEEHPHRMTFSLNYRYEPARYVVVCGYYFRNTPRGDGWSQISCQAALEWLTCKLFIILANYISWLTRWIDRYL